jgi:hypothetical protein
MGTLLLTLNKWEIVSGDLWGHYMQSDRDFVFRQQNKAVVGSSDKLQVDDF